jgi:hypothetical protein
LTLTTDGVKIFIATALMEGPAQIVAVDVQTCVGVIHIVDRLLLPVGWESQAAKSTGQTGQPINASKGGNATSRARWPEHPGQKDTVAPPGWVAGIAAAAVAAVIISTAALVVKWRKVLLQMLCSSRRLLCSSGRGWHHMMQTHASKSFNLPIATC